MRSIILLTFLAIAVALNFTHNIKLTYILALERCENAKPDSYTIHGLWPQYNETSWPQYCNATEEFDYEVLEPLYPQLDKNWQSCPEYNHTERWFLKHEWLKHGTCTNFTEYQYFSTGLALYDIIKWRKICPMNKKQCLLAIRSELFDKTFI